MASPGSSFSARRDQAGEATALSLSRTLLRQERNQPPLPPAPTGSQGGRAFTLIELLVVIAIIAVLASMTLPSLSKAKSQAQTMQCMSNTKQMGLAWRFYAADNNDTLVCSECWFCGDWESLDNPRDPNNWDADTYIRQSLLWSYCGKSTAIWRCPSDPSTAIMGEIKVVPRIRSISMNGNVGAPRVGTDPLTGRRTPVYQKLSGLTYPGPAETFVFLDERADSINDGFFNINMATEGSPPVAYGINDFPGCYHHNSAGFAFADGHSEIHRWRDPRTTPPLGTNDMTLGVSSIGNRDALWLIEHSPPYPGN